MTAVIVMVAIMSVPPLIFGEEVVYPSDCKYHAYKEDEKDNHIDRIDF